MLRSLFIMHKNDRRVILSLLFIAAVALTVIFLAGGKEQKTPISLTEKADSIAMDTLRSNPPYYYQQETPHVERFAFDPNTADSTQLLRLGLQSWQVRNIYKYRAAGGIYRKKEDFARLYGLTVKQYRELEPYIHISADYQPASTLFEDKTATIERDTLRYPVKMAEGETIDLAIADTTMLKTVPGIGSYFARRIYDYGQRLGGYVSLEQLDEIEDFPQEAKQYLTLGTIVVRKVNINTTSLNDLKRHPYINYYQARTITDYRRQYGTITDLQQLRLSPDFPPEAIARLLPYIEY